MKDNHQINLPDIDSHYLTRMESVYKDLRFVLMNKEREEWLPVKGVFDKNALQQSVQILLNIVTHE